VQRYFEWVTRHSTIIIVLSIIATAAFAFGLKYVRTEADVENMLPAGSDSVETAKKIDKIFEVEDSVIVAVVHEGKDGIFNPHSLQLIKDVTDRMSDIRGIDPSKIFSIYKVSQIIGTETGFEAPPLCENVPATRKEIDDLRDRVLTNPLYSGTLVAKNGAGTLVYGAVTPVSDKAQVYYDVRDMLDKMSLEGETFYITGHPVIQGVLGAHVQKVFFCLSLA
jgi:uncharacterized protein